LGLSLAVLCWYLALLFAWHCLPILLRPRVDGMPGWTRVLAMPFD